MQIKMKNSKLQM